MKYLVVFLASLLSCSVMADPQINADGGYAHWIFDAVNTDYEHERKQDVGITRLDNGTLNGYANNEFLVPVKVLPETLQNEGDRIDICGPSTQNPSGIISDSNCSLVDTGGTQYSTGSWWMNVRVENIAYGFATLKTGMECFNARRN